MTPEQHADAILRAAGSSLANYTMPGTRAAILAAVQAVRDDECGQVVAWLRAQNPADPVEWALASAISFQLQRGEHRSASHDVD